MRRIGRTHVALVAGAGAAAFATRWFDPASVVLGGAVMGVNFWLMQLIARAVLPAAGHPEGKRRAAIGVAAMVLKFGLFLALLAALFWRVPVRGMSFALGVTMLLVACLVEVARVEFATDKGVR